MRRGVTSPPESPVLGPGANERQPPPLEHEDDGEGPAIPPPPTVTGGGGPDDPDPEPYVPEQAVKKAVAGAVVFMLLLGAGQYRFTKKRELDACELAPPDDFSSDDAFDAFLTNTTAERLVFAVAGLAPEDRPAAAFWTGWHVAGALHGTHISGPSTQSFVSTSNGTSWLRSTRPWATSSSTSTSVIELSTTLLAAATTAACTAC